MSHNESSNDVTFGISHVCVDNFTWNSIFALSKLKMAVERNKFHVTRYETIYFIEVIWLFTCCCADICVELVELLFC